MRRTVALKVSQSGLPPFREPIAVPSLVHATLPGCETLTNETQQSHRGEGVANPKLAHNVLRICFANAGEVCEKMAFR